MTNCQPGTHITPSSAAAGKASDCFSQHGTGSLYFCSVAQLIASFPWVLASPRGVPKLSIKGLCQEKVLGVGFGRSTRCFVERKNRLR